MSSRLNISESGNDCASNKNLNFGSLHFWLKVKKEKKEGEAGI